MTLTDANGQPMSEDYHDGWHDGFEARDEHIGKLTADTEQLRAALKTLIASAKPCPSCHKENDCYVFSMTALSGASRALEPKP